MPLVLVVLSSRVTRLRLEMDTQTSSSEMAIQSGSPPTASVASGRNSSMERLCAEGEPGGEDCAMPAGASNKSANDKSKNEGGQKRGSRSAFMGIEAAAMDRKRKSSSLQPGGHDSTRTKRGDLVQLGLARSFDSAQFIRRNLEHLVDFRQAQQMADIRRRIDQRQVASAAACRDVRAHQFPETGAIEKVDLFQIQENSSLASVQKRADGLAQQAAAVVERKLSGEGRDRRMGQLTYRH